MEIISEKEILDFRGKSRNKNIVANFISSRKIRFAAWLICHLDIEHSFSTFFSMIRSDNGTIQIEVEHELTLELKNFINCTLIKD